MNPVTFSNLKPLTDLNNLTQSNHLHNKLVLPPIVGHLPIPNSRSQFQSTISNTFSNITQELRNFIKHERQTSSALSKNCNEDNHSTSAADLEKLFSDFSPPAQQKFEEIFQSWTTKITAFQKKFNESNKDYRIASQDQLNSEFLQEKFCQINAQEKQERFNITISYHKFEEYCSKRKRALISAIAQQKLELVLLEQVLEESHTLLKKKFHVESTRHYFNPISQLFETSKLKTTELEPDPLFSNEGEAEHPFAKFGPRFIHILCEINVLQQLILKIDCALRKEITLNQTRLAHKYHAYYVERLKNIKESFEIFNSDFDQEFDAFKETADHNEGLDNRINTAMRMRRDAFFARCIQIEGLLVSRKENFQIPDSQIPPIYPFRENPILDLIERIITLKEKIELNDKKNELEKKRLIKELAQLRWNAQFEIWPQHNQLVQTNVATYHGYINTLEEEVANIHSLFRLLEVDALQRLSWNLNLKN